MSTSVVMSTDSAMMTAGFALVYGLRLILLLAGITAAVVIIHTIAVHLIRWSRSTLSTLSTSPTSEIELTEDEDHAVPVPKIVVPHQPCTCEVYDQQAQPAEPAGPAGPAEPAEPADPFERAWMRHPANRAGRSARTNPSPSLVLVHSQTSPASQDTHHHMMAAKPALRVVN